MTPPPAAAEHLWLHRLVGDWTWSNEAIPGEPAGDAGHDHDHSHGEATESWRLLGNVWALGEGGGDHGRTLLTLGHDADAGGFVGSFITDMITFFWQYQGELQGPDKLVLRARGPNMGPEGGMANYRDEIYFIGADERTLCSFMEQPDGTWQQFMQARYRRK